ncbi:hypothetical protein [Algibacter lectus]|uniref:hypothetical protein n=1 Tax=Algibacter lectus TaxID=221126 RepID=UPI00249456DF|nr:hypothetical protein [Algibacter lectus]
MIKKIFFSIYILCLTLLFISCNKSKNNKASENPIQVLTNGKQLAEMHCVRCHQFPKAEILPKRYWKEVLPIMGLHYGKIKEGKFFSDFGNKVAKERLLSSGLFPQTDIISDEDWEAIMAYYNDNAPENLPRELKPVFNYNMSQFSKEALPWKSLGDGLTYMNFNDGNY